MTTVERALIECTNLAHTYGSGRTAVVAVQGVNAVVTCRTRVALTGASGSGKSTLLHMMAGLEAPTSGSITWPAWGASPLGEPGRAGMVFQGPSLMPFLNVVENVSFPVLLLGVTEQLATERAMSALDSLALTDLARQLPETLSGGQSQRVAIARVIACEPSMILADEPTGQLDHEAGAVVMEVLLQAADRLGAALVVATHDPLVAARLPDRWIMRDGRVQPRRHDLIETGAQR